MRDAPALVGPAESDGGVERVQLSSAVEVGDDLPTARPGGLLGGGAGGAAGEERGARPATRRLGLQGGTEDLEGRGKRRLEVGACTPESDGWVRLKIMRRGC